MLYIPARPAQGGAQVPLQPITMVLRSSTSAMMTLQLHREAPHMQHFDGEAGNQIDEGNRCTIEAKAIQGPSSP